MVASVLLVDARQVLSAIPILSFDTKHLLRMTFWSLQAVQFSHIMVWLTRYNSLWYIAGPGKSPSVQDLLVLEDQELNNLPTIDISLSSQKGRAWSLLCLSRSMAVNLACMVITSHCEPLGLKSSLVSAPVAAIYSSKCVGQIVLPQFQRVRICCSWACATIAFYVNEDIEIACVMCLRWEFLGSCRAHL